MPSRQHLERDLFVRLNEHPRLKSFFETMLLQRLKSGHSDWLENDLVQVLLRNYKPSLDLLDGLISNAEKYGGTMLTDLVTDLHGEDPEFDGKLSDLLAEFNGISWLKANGYTRFKKLPTSTTPVPEFEAYKTDKEYVEVKNLRKPINLTDLLFRAVDVQSLLEPERFSTLHLDIEVSSSNWSKITETDKRKASELVSMINTAPTRSVSQCQLSYSIGGAVRTSTVTMTCKWRPGHGTAMSSAHAIWQDDPTRFKKLRSILAKTWVGVGKAIDQLESYDDGDHNKWVLLNWQRPSEYIFDTALVDRFAAIVADIDKQVKLIDSKLNVVIMR